MMIDTKGYRQFSKLKLFLDLTPYQIYNIYFRNVFLWPKLKQHIMSPLLLRLPSNNCGRVAYCYIS